MPAKNMVRAVANELVLNATLLSKLRWSGVHKVENFDGTAKTVYRVAYSDVFARALNELIEPRDIAAMIKDIPRITFDCQSQWFTIETEK